MKKKQNPPMFKESLTYVPSPLRSPIIKGATNLVAASHAEEAIQLAHYFNFFITSTLKSATALLPNKETGTATFTMKFIDSHFVEMYSIPPLKDHPTIYQYKFLASMFDIADWIDENSKELNVKKEGGVWRFSLKSGEEDSDSSNS